MEKLPKTSQSITDENIEKIRLLFPNVVTETTDSEGKEKYAVDFDTLRQELSPDAVDNGKERYRLTWPDKSKAILLANSPTSNTLRPVPELSVDAETTKNIYIEGDNLEALKLLRQTYLGKVKMIYIDPPYNTGHDFVYEDDFSESADEYLERSGQIDAQGNRLQENLQANGRFHTDWLNMMYPRLKIARDFLTDDGVIFISIDDHEQANLRKMCDEIFGEQNFVAQLIWERAYSPKNDAKFISNSHDYVVMYAKSISDFKIGRLPRTEEANARYSNPDNDPRGVWKASDLSVKTYSAENDYSITTPSGRIVEPPAGRCWRLSKKAFLERLQDNRIWFGPDGDGVPALKRFLTDLKHEGMAPTSILRYKEVGHSQEGAQELSKLLGGGYFDGPKPTRLIDRLITLANLDDDSIVMDFFAGSSTTGHSVFKSNDANNTHHQFILVQIPEECAADSKAYAAGYTDICQIGITRLRKAAEQIRVKSPLTSVDADLGFRVFKVDTTNYLNVWNAPSEVFQESLSGDNIKEDRTPVDLLVQAMLDLGIPLSAHVDGKKSSTDKAYYIVEDNQLLCCFETGLIAKEAKELAEHKPAYAVFRDSCFSSDQDMVNFQQIFGSVSPNTELKVL